MGEGVGTRRWGAPAEWLTLSAGRIGRRVTLALWLVVMVAATPMAMKLAGTQQDGPLNFLSAGAESTRVALLREAIPGSATGAATVVYQRPGGLLAADVAAVQSHYDELVRRYVGLPASLPDGLPNGIASAGAGAVTGGSPAGPAPSADGTALMYGLSIPTAGGDAATAAAIADLRTAVGERPAGLTALVTGPTALDVDFDAVLSGINAHLLLTTIGVVAMVLMITYRNPFLWLLPMVATSFGALSAMAVMYQLSRLFGLTVSTQSGAVMTVLVFGAGTHYALLLVARYREELIRSGDATVAMRTALRRAGPAIVTSAATSTVGLLSLLAADLDSSRALASVGAVGIVCTLLALMTALPAMLVTLGPRAFWPLSANLDRATRQRETWARLGATVARRPVRSWLGATVVLGALAMAAITLPGHLPDVDGFTSPPESVTGARVLAAAYPDAATGPVTVLVRDALVNQVTQAVRSTPDVTRVIPGGSGGGWTELTAQVGTVPDSAAERAMIGELRARLRRIADGDALVGGAGAQRLDESITVARDRRVVIPLVVVLVGLLLGLLLRSVVAPLLLLATVLLSYSAALGVGALSFAPLLGFAGAAPDLPLVTFVFLVGLGVDYGIFLLVRIRQEAPVLGTGRSVVAAVASTGPVIASAGLVLAATFAVLSTLPTVKTAEIGFVVAVGVLLQTLLVQAVQLPGLALMLDRWLWWPGRLSRPPAPVGLGSAAAPAARVGSP